MPVSVEIKDSAPAVKGKVPAPLQEAITLARDPNEIKMGALALGLWLLAIVGVCLPWWLSEATLPFARGMPVWALLAILICFVFVPGQIIKRKREAGAAARISKENRPAIKTLLSKAAPLLGVAEPEAFIDESAEDARLRVYPGALIFNKGLWGKVEETEAGVLAARGLSHERLGHARRLAIIDLIERADPPVLRLLIWPVWIYALLLQKLWLGPAQLSADRLAALLVRNAPLLLSAILKEHASHSERMRELDVQSKDVSDWIAQKGHIGMAGEEISTQYKLGRAIHEDPVFESRMQMLQKWHGAPEFKVAVDKLMAARTTRK